MVKHSVVEEYQDSASGGAGTILQYVTEHLVSTGTQHLGRIAQEVATDTLRTGVTTILQQQQPQGAADTDGQTPDGEGPDVAGGNLLTRFMLYLTQGFLLYFYAIAVNCVQWVDTSLKGLYGHVRLWPPPNFVVLLAEGDAEPAASLDWPVIIEYAGAWLLFIGLVLAWMALVKKVSRIMLCKIKTA